MVHFNMSSISNNPNLCWASADDFLVQSLILSMMNENFTELLTFLKAHRCGELVINSDDVLSESVIVAVSESSEIIFQTLETTPKCQNLRKYPNVAFVVGLDKHKEQVRLEGFAEELKGEDRETLKILYFSFFPNGRLRDQWPGITYFRVRPRWARYSNFLTDRIVEFNERYFAQNPASGF